MLVIAGTAANTHHDTARTFITTLGRHEADVAAMVADANVRLTVVIDAPPEKVQAANSDESSDELDGKTVLSWQASKSTTLIDIAVPMLPGDDGGHVLVATLLHELVLHALPGFAQHRSAVQAQRRPAYPATDEDIEAAETREHGDVARWVRMVGLGEAVAGQWLKDLAVIDAGQHDVGAPVLAALVAQRSITEAQSAAYLKKIRANGGS